MSDTLVDSSAWVDFFRGRREAIVRVDPLLADARAAVSGPIYAEVLSGARSEADFDHLKILFASLDWLEEPAEIWDSVARTRFLLGRKGHQASIADLLIAVIAVSNGQTLLTRDRDFQAIAKVLPLDLQLF